MILASGLRVPEPGAAERTMDYPIILGLSLVGLIVTRRVQREAKLLRAAARVAGRPAGRPYGPGKRQSRRPAGSAGAAPTPQP